MEIFLIVQGKEIASAFPSVSILVLYLSVNSTLPTVQLLSIEEEMALVNKIFVNIDALCARKGKPGKITEVLLSQSQGFGSTKPSDLQLSSYPLLALLHVKTYGRTMIIAGGLPVPILGHPAAIAETSLKIRSYVASQSEQVAPGYAIQITMGLHIGPVVAGVIGRRQQSYDVWGYAFSPSKMEGANIRAFHF